MTESHAHRDRHPERAAFGLALRALRQIARAGFRRRRHIARGAPAPFALRLLLLFERTLFRAPDFGDVDLCPPAPQSKDLIVDLTGAPATEPETPTLRLAFDGAFGDLASAGALLERRAPRIDLVFAKPGETPRIVATATPALEARDKFVFAHRAVAAASTALICDAARRLASGLPFVMDEAFSPRDAASEASALGFAATSLMRKISRRLTELSVRPEHFRVVWRRVDAGGSIAQTLDWPDAPFTEIPDDGARYFADPFLFAKDGRSFIFCEEFPYATGKGALCAFELTAGGVSEPIPIMEQPYHLSYPQVFAREGEIWMIPETSGANRIELFRCERFPDLWRFEAVLIDNLRAADATLVEHHGRLWLFATVAKDGLSDWDALHLFCADALRGPWRAHSGNPVLIDASAARPAGPMFFRDGALWRPAQDCSQGYGGGLALCRVDRLDEEGFSQSVMKRLKPRPAWRAHGAHHLHFAEGIEVIDVAGAKPRA